MALLVTPLIRDVSAISGEHGEGMNMRGASRVKSAEDDAIFYILRTGCQCQALDQTELCAHSTAHDRFQEWVNAGDFLKLW